MGREPDEIKRSPAATFDSRISDPVARDGAPRTEKTRSEVRDAGSKDPKMEKMLAQLKKPMPEPPRASTAIRLIRFVSDVARVAAVFASVQIISDIITVTGNIGKLDFCHQPIHGLTFRSV